MHEYSLQQREYDGKWQLLKKVPDSDNTITTYTKSGLKMTFTPEKWITVNVYDFLIEVEENE